MAQTPQVEAARIRELEATIARLIREIESLTRALDQARDTLLDWRTGHDVN